MVCCFDLKKSRNDWRICELVITELPRIRKSPRFGECKFSMAYNGTGILARALLIYTVRLKRTGRDAHAIRSQFFAFRRSRISVSNVSVGVGTGTASIGCLQSRFMTFITMKMQNATIRKSRIVLMNEP